MAPLSLAALRGAVGFLTRIPVGHDETGWQAFVATPATVPLVGYLVGALAALAFLVPAPPTVTAFLYVLALYAITGINHADGVADIGDAAVVHGDPERRLSVLKDSSVGVGGTLALIGLVAGLVLAAIPLADAPLAVAVSVVVSAEVGAKLGTATLVCLGTAPHDGLGSQLTGVNGPRSLVAPVLVALPVVLLARPPYVAAVAIVGALAVALWLRWWSSRALGGVNGDVLGAATELGRLGGLIVSLLAWTVSAGGAPEVIVWTLS
jgi:adenosylcobinamide-GDP ribazoletransferase